jgi:hypothetical protein
MSDARRLAEITRAAVEHAGNRPPLEMWEDLIRKGFIDRQGRVTRLIGGRAEPEPEALEAGGSHSSASVGRSRVVARRRTTGPRGAGRIARRRR